MVEKNKDQEFKLKKLDKTRNYFIEEINQNELMSKKQKKVYTTFNYIEHLFILASTITGCIYISPFAFSVGIPIESTSSAVAIKFVQ